MERSELAAWLRLVHTPGLSSGAQRRLLAALGSPAAVFEAPSAALHALLKEPQRALLARPPEGFDALLSTTQAWLAAAPGRRLLPLGDPDYPAPLLQTADPPTLLYLWGRAELLARESLAIVGSRSPTPQGRDTARSLGRALGQGGLTIVSGLALGIDGAAHEGALDTEGGTVAVLGSGLAQLYPPAHRALAGRIAERGLLLSEYPLDMPPLPDNFPRRNRLIGLSRGCLVVEAALRSGSLITARLAAEAGREVFAIPGSIHAPQSRGCHALLREGAKLVETAEDVLEELRGQRPRPPVAVATEPAPAGETGESGRLLQAMGFDPVGLDALQARGGWPAEQLSALLLELELDGQVARLPGGLFQRRQQG